MPAFMSALARTAATALLLASAASATLAQTQSLKIGHITPPTHVWHQLSEKIATDLDKASGGQMKASVNPLAKLGNEVQMIQLMHT